MSIVPGCGWRRSTRCCDIPPVQQPLSVAVSQQEARWIDIAIPLNAHSINRDQLSPAACMYIIHQKLSDMVEYYEKEMERAGWLKVVAFNECECLIIFEKPHKFAAISLRSLRSNECQVYIVVAVRDDNSQ